MKTTTNKKILLVAACVSGLFLSACAKKEEPAPPAAASDTQRRLNDAVGQANTAVTTAAGEVPKQAAEVKTSVQTAVGDAQKKVEETSTAAQVEAQSLIDRIKALFAEKKYPEALASLEELSKLKLTDQQQQWLNDFKTQVQKAMASQTVPDATKALGGLLEKK